MAKENHELAFGVSSWLWGDDDLIAGIPIPSEGEIDWERFMSIVARVNYNGVLVVELPPKGPIESR